VWKFEESGIPFVNEESLRSRVGTRAEGKCRYAREHHQIHRVVNRDRLEQSRRYGPPTGPNPYPARLEEEVEALLGRKKHERKPEIDAPAGYRNGYGKERKAGRSIDGVSGYSLPFVPPDLQSRSDHFLADILSFA
jgi:hypothetical protein